MRLTYVAITSFVAWVEVAQSLKLVHRLWIS
jgi:hypothetical protein